MTSFRPGDKVTFSGRSGNKPTAKPLTVCRAIQRSGRAFHELDEYPGGLFTTESLVPWPMEHGVVTVEGRLIPEVAPPRGRDKNGVPSIVGLGGGVVTAKGVFVPERVQ